MKMRRCFLGKAIQIMEKQPGTRVEVATSRTSLALIELKMDKLEAAEKHLELAISAFKEDGGKTDTHYSAALARTRRGLLPSGQSGTLPGKL